MGTFIDQILKVMMLVELALLNHEMLKRLSEVPDLCCSGVLMREGHFAEKLERTIELSCSLKDRASQASSGVYCHNCSWPCELDYHARIVQLKSQQPVTDIELHHDAVSPLPSHRVEDLNCEKSLSRVGAETMGKTQEFALGSIRRLWELRDLESLLVDKEVIYPIASGVGVDQHSHGRKNVGSLVL